MPPHFCRSVIGLLVSVAPVFAVVSAGAADRTTKEAAEFVWDGMQAQRLQLRSGIYRAQGRLAETNTAWGTIDGDMEIYSAFDLDRELLRFDRIEPFRDRKHDETGDPNTTWFPGTTGGKLISIPDTMYSVQSSRTACVIDSLATKPLNETITHPFDIRALGLYFWPDLIKCSTFESLVKGWMKHPPAEAVEESPGVYRLRWLIDPDRRIKSQIILWIDGNKGFTPLRFEGRTQRVKAGETQWSDPESECEMTWTQINDVWVPTAYNLISKSKSGNSKSLTLAFDWESANAPVPPELFTIDAFRLPEGATIIDNRLKPPVIVGTIGRAYKPEALSLGQVRPRNAWWLYLLGLNIIAITTLGLWYLYQRKRGKIRPN